MPSNKVRVDVRLIVKPKPTNPFVPPTSRVSYSPPATPVNYLGIGVVAGVLVVAVVVLFISVKVGIASYNGVDNLLNNNSAEVEEDSTSVETQKVATSAPTLVPTTVVIGSVDATLKSQDFRVGSGGENAAVFYQISFTNRAAQSAQIAFNKTKIAAVDNAGRVYEDYFAVAQKSMALCVFASVDWRQYLEVDMRVASGETKTVDLYLNPTGLKGECQKGGVAMGRVPIDTNYIDITISGLQVRSDQLYQPAPIKWRLQR